MLPPKRYVVHRRRRFAMNATADQFVGCILGLAIGDALGAPYEGGPVERLIWRLIGRTSDGCMRWTDDTQMALDLATALLEDDGVRPDALARRFAASYQWSRGYGPGAAKILKRIRRGQSWETATKSVYVHGSYGNGAAMRAPVLALFYVTDREGLLDAARRSALVTHAHPLGVEGAVMMALAAQLLLAKHPSGEVLAVVQMECSAPELAERLSLVVSWLEKGVTVTPSEVVAKLGNGMTTPTSCPTALYIALRHLYRPFEELMQFAVQCRGDVDTIGAMAGALWGIANGAGGLPSVSLEARDVLTATATRLFERYRGK